MRHFDVFNGDADGLCALHQLRLAEPADSELVTGLKHEVALLERVEAGEGDRITVLDVSLERNRAALLRLLERGAAVRYFDHHRAGDIPVHPRLEAHIDAGGLACTSELVDRVLGGRFRPWAVVAAFGDNLPEAARRLASGLDIDPGSLALLESLGQALNYNAYGFTREDVLLPPEALYQIVSRHADPFALRLEPAIARLEQERRGDMARAEGEARRLLASPGHEAWLLPDERWARRVQGVFANQLAAERPGLAVAVLVPIPPGGHTVSVRAPAGSARSAADFCRRFPGGGGRVTAAGITHLERGRLDAFLEEFAAAYTAC